PMVKLHGGDTDRRLKVMLRLNVKPPKLLVPVVTVVVVPVLPVLVSGAAVVVVAVLFTVCWSTLSSRGKRLVGSTFACAVITQGRPLGPTATEAATCGCGSGTKTSKRRVSALNRRSSPERVTTKIEPSGPMEMLLAVVPMMSSHGEAAQRT